MKIIFGTKDFHLNLSVHGLHKLKNTARYPEYVVDEHLKKIKYRSNCLDANYKEVSKIEDKCKRLYIEKEL